MSLSTPPLLPSVPASLQRARNAGLTYRAIADAFPEEDRPCERSLRRWHLDGARPQRRRRIERLLAEAVESLLVQQAAQEPKPRRYHGKRPAASIAIL